MSWRGDVEVESRRLLIHLKSSLLPPTRLVVKSFSESPSCDVPHGVNMTPE